MSVYKIIAGSQSLVWCVGSSIVRYAFIAAKSSPEGSSLGLDKAGINLWWQGYSGLNLVQTRSKIQSLSYIEQPPDYLVLHCGGNDIGKTPVSQIRILISQTFTFIMTLFPNTKILWSQILPRLTWRYSSNNQAMERSRVRLNSYAGKQTLSLGGAYIKHANISTANPSLFYSDGVHLSAAGNELFLTNIKESLSKIIQENWSVYPSNY